MPPTLPPASENSESKVPAVVKAIAIVRHIDRSDFEW